MSRVIFHIDVNSAYLSWEAVFRLQHGGSLDLRTIPSAVGGDPKKRSGIILAKSTPAKAYKIQTGETLVAAFQKCPNLVVVPPNYNLYMKSSDSLVALLREYSDHIQRFSVDEVFMEISDMKTLYPDPWALAEIIRKRIKEELGFTVSIGISSNKLLAKMAGELKKPDGVSSIWPEEIEEKMWPLPVEELFMVGRATMPKLNKLGIFTIGDLAQYDLRNLEYSLKSHGRLIWQYAQGLEDSVVKKDSRVLMKGIGNSTTIPFDVDNAKEAHMIILSLSEMVGMRLRASGMCAMLVSVSIKTSEFGHYSHQQKFYTPTDSTMQIYDYAKKLFDDMWQGELIRHLGVRVSELCLNDMIQLNLFERPLQSEKLRALDAAIDRLRARYDNQIITRACFLNSGIKPISGGLPEDEYPLMSSML